MKRLAVVLLSGLLLVALSFLGVTETTSKPMGYATTTDTPTVTGDILNPVYYAHAAYVMQGVSDRDEVFAMPLRGVPELDFLPTVTGIDPASVTWSLQISHPEGIGAEIAEDTLYIWGKSATWSGYGAVTLTATSGNVSGSVTIPVTVFRTDKTLISSDGKKDYFVPWAPQLDINRILSVEGHMRKYNKGEGSLDRAIQFSRWRRMEYKHDMDVGSGWLNEIATSGRWPESTQLALVDVYLDDLQQLGIDGIRVENEYYIASAASTAIAPIYDLNLTGLSKRVEEQAYLVNEAHRRHMSVMMGNLVSIGSATQWAELFYASPTPLSAFFASLAALNSVSLANWSRWGVDAVDLCPAVSSVHQYQNTSQQATELASGITSLAVDARLSYPGPLYHGVHFQADFFPGTSILEAPFWDSFDIIGLSGWNIDLTGHAQATVAELVSGWKSLIGTYFAPFQKRWDRPFLMWENGAIAATGCANYGLICSRTAAYDSTKPSVDDVANYYRAQDVAFRDMEGYFGPGWYSYPFTPYFRGGVRDTITSTPRLKIEDTLQAICLGKVRPTKIVIDTASGDWSDAYLVGSDPVGDSRGANDIVSLSFTQDESYLYFGVRYSAPPTSPGILLLRIDTNGDGNKDAELFLNNIWTDIHDWVSELYEGGLGAGLAIGFADAIDAGNLVEMRLARRFLEGYLAGSSFRVQLAHFDKDWRLQDETAWFSVSP